MRFSFTSSLLFFFFVFWIPNVGAQSRLQEVWAYLMAGEEASYRPGQPITDIGYFGAGISPTGTLTGVPSREKIKGFPGRVHLVVAEVTSTMASHFVLNPAYPLRQAFIADIVKAATPYDGVQIDFETLLPQDKEHFYTFLAELNLALGDKTFSVAVPARLADSRGIWDYSRLNGVADKVIIMAYDEHWSGSAPGSVASLDWCLKVARYAKSRISPGKLVMGLPFYGRAWADRSHSKAYRHRTVAQLMEEFRVRTPSRSNHVPWFEYTTTVNVKVFYEDAVSLGRRVDLYTGQGITQVAFWRLGQEDPAVWNKLTQSVAGTPDAVPLD